MEMFNSRHVSGLEWSAAQLGQQGAGGLLTGNIRAASFTWSYIARFYMQLHSKVLHGPLKQGLHGGA